MAGTAFLALLAFLGTAGVPADHARVPSAEGVTLDAALVMPPAGVKQAAPVVALHGCGGPFPSRDGTWAVELARQGHPVLLPDSFGSRGLGSQCREKNRTVAPARERRADAEASGRWLASFLPSAMKPALVGWSNGGGTVVAAAGHADSAFDRFVAFYPGCGSAARDAKWMPVAKMLILVGAADEWTPAAPCQQLAAHHPQRIEIVTYPGAYHDFDAPDLKVRLRTGLASAPNGQAHVGTDPAARADALRRVPVFLDAAR